MKKVPLAAIPFLLTAACGSSSQQAGVSSRAALTPTFSSITANIFQSKCLSCHSGAQAQAGVQLESYAAIMNAPETHHHEIVTPRDAENSHIYEAVKAGEMPPGGPKLTDAELQAIHDWIQGGAPNN
ncbi:MAG: c-type cytochrome domain-containing protein [Bdellovibrionota bacterium]